MTRAEEKAVRCGACNSAVQTSVLVSLSIDRGDLRENLEGRCLTWAAHFPIESCSGCGASAADISRLAVHEGDFQSRFTGLLPREAWARTILRTGRAHEAIGWLLAASWEAEDRDQRPAADRCRRDAVALTQSILQLIAALDRDDTLASSGIDLARIAKGKELVGANFARIPEAARLIGDFSSAVSIAAQLAENDLAGSHKASIARTLELCRLASSEPE